MTRPTVAKFGDQNAIGGIPVACPHRLRGSVPPDLKASLLLRVSVVYWGAAGALALLTSRSAAAALKPDPTPFDVFTTRTIGATLIAFAIANWSATPRPGILLANVVLNAVLGGVDTIAIADGTIGSDAWRGVAVHGGFIAAFAWALVGVRARPGRRPESAESYR